MYILCESLFCIMWLVGGLGVLRNTHGRVTGIWPPRPTDSKTFWGDYWMSQCHETCAEKATQLWLWPMLLLFRCVFPCSACPPTAGRRRRPAGLPPNGRPRPAWARWARNSYRRQGTPEQLSKTPCGVSSLPPNTVSVEFSHISLWFGHAGFLAVDISITVFK